jgi:hypothetical protein
MHEGQQPANSQNESNSTEVESSSSEEEDSTPTVHTHTEQSTRVATFARSTYASAVMTHLEGNTPFPLAEMKERYAQLRKLAKKQLRKYIETKKQMQELEKRMIDQPNVLYSDDDDDDEMFARYDLMRAGNKHADNKTNMAASSASSNALVPRQREERMASSEYSLHENMIECIVCTQKHAFSRCPLLRNKTCYNCGVTGHIKILCREPRNNDSDTK